MRTFNPGWPDQLVKDFAGLVHKSIDYQRLRELIDSESQWNADEEAAAITTPTLLIHDKQNVNMDEAETRRVAGLIKNSRVVFANGILEGQLAAQQFLRGETANLPIAAPPSDAPSAETSSLRTVLFTDLVGHTEMMSRLGDEAGRAVLREHERITRDTLKAHGGTEVKTMGDGFMASFGSVTRAVECAIALQRAIQERNTGTPSRTPESPVGQGPSPDTLDPNPSTLTPLHIRVGLNAGEPIEEDGDLFGATVILASRIAAKAGAGEILVANAVRELCSGKGFLFADRGDFVAKGFEDPVRIYEVNWRE
jgi:class 3 adenylate cyclase